MGHEEVVRTGVDELDGKGNGYGKGIENGNGNGIEIGIEDEEG